MDVVQSAIQQASAHGLPVTLIVIGHDGGPDDPIEEAYAQGAKPAAEATPAPGTVGPPVADISSAAAGLRAENETLKEQLVAAERRGSELSAQLEALRRQVTESGAATQPGAETAVDPAAPAASFEGYGVDTLGLSEKAQKGVRRVSARTVGELKEALLTGRLKSEGKLPKDSIIEVAEKLLGRVPSIPSEGAGPSAGNGTGTAPAGHSDRSWPERLAAAFKKELRARDCKAKMEKMQQEIGTLKAQQITPDVKARIDALEASHSKQDKLLGMFDGQVVGMLWACNLPHDLSKVGTINGSLQAAGLAHLMTDPPAPVA